MSEKKKIRIRVLSYVEIETNLPVEEAMVEFERNSQFSISNTKNTEVIDHQVIDMKRISYLVGGK